MGRCYQEVHKAPVALQIVSTRGVGFGRRSFSIQSSRVRGITVPPRKTAMFAEKLGAPRHPRERVRGDENSAVFIERSLSVECLTRHVFD